MNKFCIFCGKKPYEKNKEHVIPKWLIKLTEHQGRKTHYGIKNNKLIEFPWMEYTFPACKICNGNFSKLEGRVKLIICALLKNEQITQIEINDLLDWFDKVRIGLWLGQALLYGEELNPNYYIDQRVGISDRLLAIYRSKEEENGLAFSGTNSLVFKYSPTCFHLIINNLSFFNYSSSMLLSKNMGFPYPEKIELYSKGKLGLRQMLPGLSRLTIPFLRTKTIAPGVKIYQTILKANEGKLIIKPFPEYITKNAMSLSESFFKSKPFIIDEFSDYSDFLDQDKKLTFNIKAVYPKAILIKSIASMVFKHQNIEIERLLESLDHLPVDKKNKLIKLFKNFLEINNQLIKKLENDLRPIRVYQS